MYKINGEQYSQEDLQEIADIKGYTVDELLSKNPNITKEDNTEGKKIPTAQGAENVGVTSAPSTGSKSDDGSLAYTDKESYKEFYEGESKFTKTGGAEIRQTASGDFEPLALEEVIVTGKDKTDIGKQKQKKQEAFDRQFRIKQIAAASKAPEFAVSATAGMAATTVDIVTGLFNFVDKYGVAPMNYAIGSYLGYDTTLEAEAREKAGDLQALNDVSNFLRQYTIKKYDEDGNEQDILSLIEQDNYADAAELAFSEGFSAAPYLALSIAAPGAGSALIGMSVTGQEVETALKERTDATLAEIYGASALKGGIEFATNMIGGGIQRGILGIGKKFGVGTNAYKQAVDIYTKTYLGKLADAGIGLTKGGATNFVEEFSASTLSSLTDVAVYNDPYERNSIIRQGVNEGLVGLALGAPVGSAGSFKSLAAKQQALEFLAPKKWTADLAKQSKRLAEAKFDLEKAPEGRKDKFRKKVQKVESIIEMKKKQLQNSFDNLTKKEKKQYAANLAKADGALANIGNNKYSASQQAEAQQELTEANAANEALVGNGLFDAKAEGSIGKILKSSERLAEAIAKTGKKVGGVEIEYLSAEQAKNIVFKDGSNLSTKDAAYIEKENKVYINRDVSALTGQTNAIGHELLHYIINSKFNTDNASMEPLVESFKDYLKETQPELHNRIQERIDANYTEINENGERVVKEGALEEYFNVFADLVSKEKIIVNESILDKVKNSTTKFLNGLGFGSVKLETGKDVFNFIRNYQDNISKFKFKQLGVDIKSSKIPQKVKAEVEKSSLSGDAIQKIYEEKGIGGAMDIIEAYKPLTTKLTKKYEGVPGYEFELLQSEIELGKRGLLDLIQAYKPGKGATLNTYIQGQLSKRAIEAANRILDTEFKLDVTESKGVVAAETAEEIVEREEAPVDVAKEIKSLRKEIGLPDELVETVKQAVIKTFGTKLPNPEDPKFRLELQKRFRTELKKPIAKFVGTRANYENFLRDNFEAIYAKLPQSLLNKRFDEFIEPVLDEDGKQLREKTAEGNKIFAKKKISKAEFIKYFLGTELGSSTKGARKTTIVEAIAEEMAFDATMEVLSDPDVSQKYQDIAELTDQPLPENFKALVAKQVDRAEDFKFSQSLIEDSGLTPQELNQILSMSWLEIAKGNPAIAEAIYDEAWTKSFPRDFENIILPGLADAVKKQETKEEKAALVRQFIQLYSRPLRTASSVKSVELNLTRNDAILRVIRKALGEDAKGVIGFSGKQNIIYREKVGGNTLLFYKKQKINAVSYDITDNATKQKIVDGKISKEEMLQQNNSALRNVKDIIFGLGVENPGLALTTLKLMQKDNRSEFRQAAKLNAIVKNYKGKLQYEHNPPTNIVYGEIVKYLKNPTPEGKDALINLLNNWEANIVPKDFAEIVDQKYKDKMPEDGLRYKEAFEQTNYKFDGVVKFSKSLSSEFNGFIEEKTGIDKRTKISEKRAAMIGEGKGRFKFFLPPNAEDFMGLLYTTLLPGKRGDEQIAFYKEQLVDPFARGIRKYQSAKEQTIRELKALKKAIKKVPTKLAGKNETGFTNEVAVRVYLWNKNGYEVPGLKKKEVKDLVRVVANNSDLREFALNINAITRGNGYPEAENNWEAGTITTDLLEMLNTTTRKESLAEFINNKDQIFSKDNLNKLQAAFGKDYRFALEDALGRMVSGRKRYTGIDKDSKKFLDWLNGAVGTIMFWNSRSAILQMLSVVNYTNFSDNNIFNQVKTFANQKQYWSDWHTLMFSDFLKQRRAGSQLDVNINDIMEAAEGSTNPGKAIFAKLIRLGYAPTQIADSFAISTGGAAFYRNRINKYKKDGLSDQEAQDKAFLDFQEITEETQQSSRDDRISQVQAGGLGRVIFAFANTPMQYARIIKRSSQDLINGRGDWRQNISRIAFYGFLQNIIFSTLQSGLFALLIDNEDDDEVIEDRALRALNSTADSLLRGSGLPGAVLATVKNAAFEVFAELKKDRPKVWKAGLTGATSISPPINSKVRKIVGALDRLSYKSTREDIMTKGLSLENPVFDIGGKLTSAITNAPADRLLRKTENIVAAMDEKTSATQALFLTAGWSKWDLNMIDKKPEKLKLSPIKSSGIKRPKLKRKGLKR